MRLESRTIEDTRNFLLRLKTFLCARMPPREELLVQLAAIMERASQTSDQNHLKRPESAFLCSFIVQPMHDFLLQDQGLTSEEAKQALLFESHEHYTDSSSGSPSRGLPHPFSKAFSLKPQDAYRRWARRESRTPLFSGTFPDLALRAPCKPRVVIEGKIFGAKHGREHAETELVKDLYQAFFYRGLAKLPARGKVPAWDYDASIVLAYDATPDGHLAAAWNDLSQEVRDNFLKSANVSALILRS